jgi:hypothetical protein
VAFQSARSILLIRQQLLPVVILEHHRSLLEQPALACEEIGRTPAFGRGEAETGWP